MELSDFGVGQGKLDPDEAIQPTASLDELIDQITPENICPELFTDVVGAEMWWVTP
jgi:hypothetical protein